MNEIMDLELCLACRQLFQCSGELIRTGRGTIAAGGPLQFMDDIVSLHAGNELGNALSVACASSDELDKGDHAVFYFHIDRLGTGSFCFIYRENVCPFWNPV